MISTHFLNVKDKAGSVPGNFATTEEPLPGALEFPVADWPEDISCPMRSRDLSASETGSVRVISKGFSLFFVQYILFRP